VTPEQRHSGQAIAISSSAQRSMSRPVCTIPGAGRKPFATGDNPPLSGTINQTMTGQPRRVYD
jgi:hypothetical protein